ncbi:hypothetical protein Fcan01_26786 [Folsomia candida]|uniref:Uncharacterized protein n=1 Tax=Folsomia candida TaxID=158441 RepID=A0A226D1C1_FOLCA|nr:hypothetical protein Fcan01_26786 [Folsomia candida]
MERKIYEKIEISRQCFSSNGPFNGMISVTYRSESATFRDLLSHRVCLLDEDLGILVDPFGTEENFLFRQRYAPETGQFRTGFCYNGAMVTPASSIIGHLANSSFERMLTKLFTDVGMNDTTIVRKTDDHVNMRNRSAPYYQKEGLLCRLNPELLK